MLRPRNFYFAIVLLTLLLRDVAPVFCQDAEAFPENSSAGAPLARLVRVPVPIRGLVDTQVRRGLEQVLNDVSAVRGPGRPIVVLEFAPPSSGQGDNSEFGRALDLARFLAGPDTKDVRTVAFVPQTIRGHAVLVALACEEIVMHPDALMGAAGTFESHIDATVRQGYTEIANRRRTVPAVVALGMLDPALHVQRVSTTAGVRFVFSTEVSELQRTANVQSIDTVIPAGEVGLLSGDRLRLEYNFVSHLATDRQQLAEALNVSPGDLEVDPSLGGQWKAIRLELRGPITPVAVERIMRGIEDRTRSDAVNFICIVMDTPGGSLEESVRLASFLAGLDSAKVRTVAYVSAQARADASLIALACDQLVMHEEAVLGGSGARELEPEEIKFAIRTIQEIMSNKAKRWSLPAAMIDPELEVHRYQFAATARSEYFTEQERKKQADPESWQRQEAIVAVGETLEAQGKEAVDFGLARHAAKDFDEFRQHYQLEQTPELVEPNWAHELIAALATPQVAAGLLFIGFFAMIAEISAPGIGVGGFLSAVCFMLFFWSNHLQGTAGWLEVILFVAGLLFIALEIFVLPGFGIFGLGGALLVLGSLVLASQTFVIPRNDYQFGRLVRSSLIVIGAIGGVAVSGFVLRKHIERAPFFRRLQLAPLTGPASEERERREAIVQYDHLLGQVGETTTPLSPAGKAVFEDELIDVVSEGSAMDRGQTVKVVHVSGNRVIVRES